MIGNLKGSKTACIRGLKEESIEAIKSLGEKYNLTMGEVFNQVVEKYAREEGVWQEKKQEQKVILRKKQQHQKSK